MGHEQKESHAQGIWKTKRHLILAYCFSKLDIRTVIGEMHVIDTRLHPKNRNILILSLLLREIGTI